MSLFSIITINRNNALGLERTIQSVIEQTHQDYEFIIIDGASTDESINKIKQYQQHITFFVSESDQGIYDAMNKGIAQSKGQFLIFMNSGDVFVDKDVLDHVKGRIDIQKDMLIIGDSSFLYGEKFIRYLKAGKPCFRKMPTSHQAMFFRKEIFNIIGLYDTRYKVSADFDMWQKIVLKFIKKIHRIDILINCNDLRGISTIGWKDSCKECFLISKRNLPLLKFFYLLPFSVFDFLKLLIRSFLQRRQFFYQFLIRIRSCFDSKVRQNEK